MNVVRKETFLTLSGIGVGIVVIANNFKTTSPDLWNT